MLRHSARSAYRSTATDENTRKVVSDFVVISLNFSKVTKTVATRFHIIIKRKCTEFVFGCGSAPDPTGGDYSATPSWI